MNPDLFLHSLTDQGTLIFAIILCYLPMGGQLKYGWKRTLLLCAVAAAVYIPSSAVLCSYFQIPTNGILFPACILFFFCYARTLKTSLLKALFIFLTAAAICSFGTIFAVAVDVYMNPNGSFNQFSWYGLAAQYIITLLLIACLFHPMRKYLRWLIDHYHIKTGWRIIWVLPLYIIILNLLTIPIDYQNLYVGRLFSMNLILLFSRLLLILFFYYLYYLIARSHNENIDLLRHNQLLTIQANQYAVLRNHMAQTKRMRHDFRQQLRVIAGLVDKEQYGQLKQYLSEYTATLSEERPSLCANNAVDAIAGYYDDQAAQAGIRTKWRIELPETLPLSEIHFCMLLGNLLENAIEACGRQTSGDRWMDVIVKMPSSAMLVLIVENSFNGEVFRKGEDFLSTKHPGTGIGLASVASTTEHYQGMMKVEYDHNKFCVNILLNL